MKVEKTSKEKRLSIYKENAAQQAASIAKMFTKKNYLQPLVSVALRKRLSNIMAATTKSEVDAALKLSVPHYNGRTFYEPETHIVEEELMLWSETSLKGPLNSVGYERYCFLFKKCLPDAIGIFSDV